VNDSFDLLFSISLGIGLAAATVRSLFPRGQSAGCIDR
jgi:hypothetical protein